MKKTVGAIALILILSISMFSAVGVGFKVGEPSGLYLRTYTGANSFVGVTAAWSFHHDYFLVNADYNMVYPRLLADFDFSYGAGVAIGMGNEINFGVRFPLALNYRFPDVPIIVFLEVAPGFKFSPATDFDLSGGLGFSYMF
ncbi:MAG: hypothetical protein WBH84_07250 [Defluviitoga tunisiensis]|jgi:hypothetical protein|uniref:Putative secreted protein n=1 Tax=Defluviitoga tunisiensis TaxID=1006576 RepID=A0A0C7NZ69_DEFTU|nr:hypothetical protein [Defluviitoga tunisiensis]MDD3600934.1 hypothetical protein [Defluviitoga tunisiensis]MDY0379018.1 hypothetical protein [Defluviitoga tunisiensis]CEP78588.1 putative secreted protein [Defluviitoga tunisiensis]HHV01467.1 hypothetical protein [Defluviitoga tunisiensis]HOB55034.1 hypothetical protein [Defluviitoga tunisiensis]